MAVLLLAGILLMILCFYNGLLLAAGLIITGRGLYYRLVADDVSHYWEGRLLGLDEYYRQVSLTYFIPGIIMVFVAIIGVHGALKRSVSSLLSYAVSLAVLSGANAYGVSIKHSNVFSLYSYLNRVTASDDLELAEGFLYPEFGIHIFLILATVFVAYFVYEEKQREREEVQVQRRRRSSVAFKNQRPPKYSEIYTDTTILVH